ncbi:hypothetical protein PMAYCL1PPCAC_28202, partial [Pristionchus mayeri]
SVAGVLPPLVSLHQPMAEDPAAAASDQAVEVRFHRLCTIIVFRLPEDFSKADLLEIFAPHGNVTSSGIYIFQKNNGAPLKVGFASYDDTATAKSVSQMDSFKIRNTKRKVRLLAYCADILQHIRSV